KVGRMIEVYNPNPGETFGGMGSKKLVGPNIEYVANNDSHPGAQFSSEFRNLVKSEIARVSADSAIVTAQVQVPAEPSLAYAETRAAAAAATAPVHAPTTPAPIVAQAPLPAPRPANIPAAAKLAALKQQPPSQSPSQPSSQSSSRERGHE